MKDVDWTSLLERKALPPFIPTEKPAVKPKVYDPETQE
jgi:hypothetical protein